MTLETLGAVRLSGPAGDVVVNGTGRTVVASARDVQAMQSLLWTALTGMRRRPTALGIGTVLDRIGLTLDVRVRGRSLASAGHGASASIVERALGLRSVRVRAYGWWVLARGVLVGWVFRGR